MSKRLAIGSIIVIILMVFVFTATGQPPSEGVWISNDRLDLTIYDDSSTLVQDSRTYSVSEGLNWLEFEDVSSQLDLHSIGLQGQGIFARQQQFNAAQTFDITAVLKENIGQTVSLTNRDGMVYEGVLVDVDSYVILKTEDGSLAYLAVYELHGFDLPIIPDDFAQDARLDLLVDAASEGEQNMNLVYLTGGLHWVADYNLYLSEDKKSIQLNSWLSIQNNTSTTFENANITLAGGDFDRLKYVGLDTNSAASATATPPPTPAPQGAIGIQELKYLLPLPNPISLAENDTTVVEILPQTDAVARNVYVFDASPRVFGNNGFISDPAYGQSSTTTVLNYLEFSTGEDGLGIALPPGYMRIYQPQDSALILIGETQLSYTPENETVQIYLEGASGVVGERRQIGFQQISENSLEETFEIRLQNQQAEAVEVLVPERMSRGSNWEVRSSSSPFDQPDTFGVEFTVEVPPNDEVTITYTVLYIRP